MQGDMSRQMDDMQEQVRAQAGGIERVIEDLPANFYYWAVIGSIVASALFMLMGRHRLATFVGLWPPTLLNLALFNKLLRPSQEFESGAFGE